MASSNPSKTETARALSGSFVRFEGRGQPLVPRDAEVTPMEMQTLGKDTRPTYQNIKDTFKKDLSVRDSRFYISEMIANQLSVEEEEKRRFEKRVEEEVERRLSMIRSEAFAEAFAKGETEGTEKAYNEERAKLAKTMELMAASLNMLDDAKENLAKQYENALVEIAFRLAEVIVHHEIKEHPDLIHYTVTEILGRVAKDDDVRIRLSSDDFDVVSKVKTEIQKLGRIGRVTFDIEASLKSGDCIVESLSGEIASYIEEKIKNLRDKLATTNGLESDKPDSEKVG